MEFKKSTDINIFLSKNSAIFFLYLSFSFSKESLLIKKLFVIVSSLQKNSGKLCIVLSSSFVIQIKSNNSIVSSVLNLQLILIISSSIFISPKHREAIITVSKYL